MSRSSKNHPIVHRTVSAADSTDDKRLQTALVEIASQDLTVSIISQQMRISHSLEGKSASQLESICDRLRDEYHLAINVSQPKAVLLETIRETGEGEGKFIRQIGGYGNYGHCKLHIEPNKSEEGYMFTSTVSDDVLPHEYVNSIDRGVQQAMQIGVLSGHHLVDLTATVIDGSYHVQDSNPIAFEIAGLTALQNAVRRASPVLLEPMMAVEIEVPEGLGDAIRHEIHRHRGRVERKVTVNDRSEIEAIVPLSELLLSSSRGLAEFPSEFAGYEPVSDDGISSEDGSGVTANKPNYPRPGRGSEAARPDPEEG
jgi:elongation factor G